MPWFTPSKKAPFEGHFGDDLERNRRGGVPISRPPA